MQKSVVKKEIDLPGIKIQLMEIENFEIVPYQSVSNLRAIDQNNHLVWQAEAPKSHYDYYYDMYVVSQKNILICNSNASFQYEILLEDGKIVSYRMIK
jgi:hypothetical protein